ncbi:MAG: hypothetical protein EA417_08570 [Gammaproteobacteria bacterium]|nr:MAG: hypothetical protein EA417_08570 [Gammaproteobacteria bacterium]
MACTAVFSIGSAGDTFVEKTHEPAQRAEASANVAEPARIPEQRLFAPTALVWSHFSSWKLTDTTPAFSTFLVGPLLRLKGIDEDDHVAVVAHRGPGIEAHREAFAELE